MRKRIFSLLLASVILVSTTVYCSADTYAVETAMTAAEWGYLFELGSAAAGVTYSGSEEAAAFESEWEGYVAREGLYNHTHYTYEEIKTMNKNEVEEILNEVDADGEKFSTKMLRSIVEFLKSADVSTGYGTADYSLNMDFTKRIISSLGLVGESYSLDTVSEYLGVPFYSGMPPDSASYRYPIGYNTLLSQYDTYIIYVRKTSSSVLYVDYCYSGISGNVRVGIGSSYSHLSYGYSNYVRPDSSNTIYSGGGLNSSNVSSCVAVYVSPNVTFTFPGDSGLSDYTTADPLADFVFADSFPDVQAKGILAVPSLEERFKIPEASAAAAILANIRKSDTDEELINALSSAGVKVGATTDIDNPPDIDGDTETYPWLASILKALTGIRTGAQEDATRITDFLTVDMKAVSGAFDTLLAAFESRFPLLKQLAAIFSYDGKSFDQTPPVFTIQVPDCLRFAYPSENEIIILDMRIHASYYATARLLLNAFIWLMFANWIIDEFDINFHVG